VKQFKLRKLIASLSDKETIEKEIISLYIPPEASIDKTVAVLKAESDSAATRSESLKKSLQEAIKSIIQHLKQENQIPKNGLAVFAGTSQANDSERKAHSVQEIVPPEPITKFLFEVNNHFNLEPLREMLRDQKIVGIIALDAKEAGFGMFYGGHLELIQNTSSGIPGKSGKGGQSQRRYERERDMELAYYFHRVAEHAAREFLENHQITVLIVGGPGLTKDDFVKGDYLHYELRNALLSTVDTQSAGADGVKEVLSKSSEKLKNMCGPEEKRTMQLLLGELSKQDGLATYGLDSVLNALKKGEAKVALAADNTDVIEKVAVCKRCGLSKTLIVDKENDQALHDLASSPCVKCNSVDYEIEERDIIDVLEDAASKTDATVEVISTVSEEKSKLIALGGFAALLRYRPD